MVEKQTQSKQMRSKMIPEETLEHARSARAEFRKSVESLLPPGFVEHRRAARREILLAFRSLIDAALDREQSSPSK